MLRIGIFGNGRLGQAIADYIALSKSCYLLWILDQGEVPDSSVDVAIDASIASAVSEHIQWAIQNRCNLIIAATGWDTELLNSFCDCDTIGLLVAPNLSLSVAFMRELSRRLSRFACLRPGDISIFERHHSAKLDAPSGTAIDLASCMIAENPDFQEWTTGKAKEKGIHIGSSRSGSCMGFHELRYETAFETITLGHEVTSRSIFAEGAVEAAIWLHGKKGLFSFDDFSQALLKNVFNLEKKEKTDDDK